MLVAVLVGLWYNSDRRNAETSVGTEKKSPRATGIAEGLTDAKRARMYGEYNRKNHYRQGVFGISH